MWPLLVLFFLLGSLQIHQGTYVDCNFFGVFNSFPTPFLFLPISLPLTFWVFSLRYWPCVFPGVWIWTMVFITWCFGTCSLFICTIHSFYFFNGGRVLNRCCLFVFQDPFCFWMENSLCCMFWSFLLGMFGRTCSKLTWLCLGSFILFSLFADTLQRSVLKSNAPSTILFDSHFDQWFFAALLFWMFFQDQAIFN